MDISYKRSMNDTYMVIGGEEIRERDTYQTRILLENQVHGLLPCKIQKVNGEELFYYEITGCQSLKNLFENKKFDRRELENLLISVLRIMEALDEYLLNRDYLLLQPSYIFCSKENKEYYFVWIPALEGRIEEEFRQLTEYILPKIDHTDKEAVALGYGIYKESTESNMRMDALKKQMYVSQEKSVHSGWKDSVQEEGEEQEERQRVLDDFYKEEEGEENRILGKIGTIVCVIAAAGVFWAVRNIRISASFYFLAAAGIAVVVGGGIGGIYFWKSRKNKEERLESTQYIQETEVQEEEIADGYEEEMGATMLLRERRTTQAYLEKLGQENPERYVLEREITVIGKWRENVDIWLNVPTVSRLHAKIVRKEQKDFLMDINSRNGTMLNNTWLDPEQEYGLENGDIIVFAQEKFRYVFLGGERSHGLQ